MRIIAGLHKGRLLSAPNTHLVRPAADKVKGAIFNILGPIGETKVLDLFAGSGSVGLEALSRGSDLVVFVDALPLSLKCLEKNIAALKVERQARVINGRVPMILRKIGKMGPFDLVFVDPPYDKDLIRASLDGLLANNLVDASSTLILEHSPREIPAHEGFATTDTRKYGQTWVTFMRKI